MLTKNLLEVERKSSSEEIRPKYRHPEGNKDVARKVLKEYEEGRTKQEIWDRLSNLETHENFKFVRGLTKIIERNSEFVSDPPSEPEISPKEIRERLWSDGYVTTEGKRNQRIAELAKDTGVTTREVRENFWGDREENEKLVESVSEVTPEELIKKYNLSLTQTMLFDALELEFKLGGEVDYQAVFRDITRLGLMYTVDEDLKVSVTGPASLFKRTRKYGNAIAKLLPTLLEGEDWTLYAKVRSEAPYDDFRSKMVYDFEISSIHEGVSELGEYRDTEYLPDFASEKRNALVEDEYDSEVERSFASRIEKFTEGWKLRREPTILRVEYGNGSDEEGSEGVSVMIPDFGFERETAGKEFYLEIVGFWTPDYLAEKIEKVRNVETDPDVSLVLAVNDELRVSEDEFGDVEEVFFYDREVPVEPVVDRLRSIEKESKQEDLLHIAEEGLDWEEDSKEIVEVDEIAAREGYEPEAVSEYIRESDEYLGEVYKQKYVPSPIVDDIESEIESLDELVLSEVREVLGAYGLGEGFLEKIGYEIRWESFSEEDATIVRSN
jgi:predicted nuclease of restriction endonuclease-like RecB superfamily